MSVTGSNADHRLRLPAQVDRRVRQGARRRARAATACRSAASAARVGGRQARRRARAVDQGRRQGSREPTRAARSWSPARASRPRCTRSRTRSTPRSSNARPHASTTSPPPTPTSPISIDDIRRARRVTWRPASVQALRHPRRQPGLRRAGRSQVRGRAGQGAAQHLPVEPSSTRPARRAPGTCRARTSSRRWGDQLSRSGHSPCSSR